MVQCPESVPCIMPCHGPCVRGFWREYYCAWVYAAWCLAQLRTRQKLAPTRRGSLESVCRNSVLGSCQAAASQHTPSCRQQLSQGENSQQSRRLAPALREAWPGSELRIMAPNLRLRSGNLLRIVSQSALWRGSPTSSQLPPTVCRSDSPGQLWGWEWSGDL